ncbi:MAG: hypothetical protein ABIN61_08205 [candidate division WOR-3 bacterium]
MSKKFKFFLLGSLFLVFLFYSCDEEIATPEVEIVRVGPLGFLVDSSTSIVKIDSIVFQVLNGVEAILKGSYTEFYRIGGVGGSDEFLYSTPRCGNMDLRLKARIGKKPIGEPDTLYYTYLFNYPLNVKEAVEALYSGDPKEWLSVEARVHFYGISYYDLKDTFTVTHSWELRRVEE